MYIIRNTRSTLAGHRGSTLEFYQLPGIFVVFQSMPLPPYCSHLNRSTVNVQFRLKHTNSRSRTTMIHTSVGGENPRLTDRQAPGKYPFTKRNHYEAHRLHQPHQHYRNHYCSRAGRFVAAAIRQEKQPAPPSKAGLFYFGFTDFCRAGELRGGPGVAGSP